MDKYKKPEGSLISFMSNKVKEYGGINLAQGLPGYSPPKELLDILSRLATDTTIHQYAAGNGDGQLLDLIHTYYNRFGSYNKDQFLVTNGATEAISLVFTYLWKSLKATSLIDEHFSVLAFDPAYESYNNLPQIFGLPYIPYALEKDGSIDFIKLEKKIVKENVKIVFVNSPGNPLGKVWTEEEVKKIIELSEHLEFYIIFDAVYKDIYFDEPPYQPLDIISERLFYVNSFSKLLSITGWRIGYLIMHESHVTRVRSMHDYTGLCTPHVLQKAISQYLFKHSFGEEYAAETRIKLKESYDLLYPAIIKLGFKVPDVKGGYFIWSELPDKFDDGFRFAIDLYEQEKVAVIPGIHFSTKGKHFVRFNIARPVEEIQEAIIKLERFCK
jgi:aspartate/methionine/tyrosine aminotransferase